jgi:uncharacterized protein YjbI with pentapeptide repeats
MFCIYLEEPAPTGAVMTAAKDHAGREAVPPATPVEVLSADIRQADIRQADIRQADVRQADIRQTVRREVGARWDRFSEQELSALANRDDLVREVVSRYGVEKSEAQRDVDSVLKGRRI